MSEYDPGVKARVRQMNRINNRLNHIHGKAEMDDLREEYKKLILELAPVVSGKSVYVLSWALARIAQLEFELERWSNGT